MTGLLAELGKRFAERWFALLVLPGLLFTATAAVAITLGQRRWFDLGLLTERLTTVAGQAQPARTVVLALALSAVSIGSSLLARALGTPVEHVWSGRWPGVLRHLAAALTARRRRAWQLADDSDRPAARNRIALVRPQSPTWIGDRLHAPHIRVYKEYGLDLASTWSRLWLLLPDTTREPLTESRRRFDEATALGGWSLLYLALGALWWPSTVLGVTIGIIAWRRARVAADVYADLVEATIDVHLSDLYERFTDEHGVRLISPQHGRALTERFRKST